MPAKRKPGGKYGYQPPITFEHGEKQIDPKEVEEIKARWQEQLKVLESKPIYQSEDFFFPTIRYTFPNNRIISYTVDVQRSRLGLTDPVKYSIRLPISFRSESCPSMVCVQYILNALLEAYLRIPTIFDQDYPTNKYQGKQGHWLLGAERHFDQPGGMITRSTNWGALQEEVNKYMEEAFLDICASYSQENIVRTMTNPMHIIPPWREIAQDIILNRIYHLYQENLRAGVYRFVVVGGTTSPREPDTNILDNDPAQVRRNFFIACRWLELIDHAPFVVRRIEGTHLRYVGQGFEDEDDFIVSRQGNNEEHFNLTIMDIMRDLQTLQNRDDERWDERTMNRPDQIVFGLRPGNMCSVLKDMPELIRLSEGLDRQYLTSIFDRFLETECTVDEDVEGIPTERRVRILK